MKKCTNIFSMLVMLMFIIFRPLFPAFNFLGKRLDYSSTAAHFQDSGDFFLTFLNFFKPAEFDYVSNL